eukprot:12417571-Karenia_brevis.AAC.1
MQMILTVQSNIANIMRVKVKLRVQLAILFIKMGLLNEGKAVRRSTHTTNRRFPLETLEKISASKTVTASMHPQPFWKPNCSLPALHAARLR